MLSSRALAIVLGFGFLVVPQTLLADVIIEYDTGHPLGPHFLDLGVETPVEISIRDTSGLEWPLLAVFFDFGNPGGELLWDFDGSDNTPFTGDDGFSWESGLDDPVFYSAIIVPPSTVAFYLIAALRVPAITSPSAPAGLALPDLATDQAPLTT